MKNLMVISLIISLWAAPAIAETVWDVSPGRSKINFRAKHLVFSQVEGRFREFDGKVVTPNSDLSGARLKATIDIASLYTGNADRDRHLLSDDFFASQNYPKITFESVNVKKYSENSYVILGNLTMRGITRPVELSATCGDVKQLPNGKTRMDLTATGSVNRFDYNLHWNKLAETGQVIVGDTIDIEVELALMSDENLLIVSK